MGRKKSSKKRKRGKGAKGEGGTTEEAILTMETVEDDEMRPEKAGKRKKAPSELAFEKFANSVVAKKIEGLQAEFNSLKSFTPIDTKQTAFAAHKERNRYSNVPCLDATRVILTLVDRFRSRIHQID
ncbi:unnamed protein product [Anisakis simplex]|uniref:Ribosomal RNA-processing protein 8 n=1 Tax=Anisakis simplex TaxID=6269 RepID=A0A0M3KGP9_ANISI|nr:unnamed protein product [Anisakis simplex]